MKYDLVADWIFCACFHSADEVGEGVEFVVFKLGLRLGLMLASGVCVSRSERNNSTLKASM